ncbi:single-strand binding protein, putative [Babesia bigemina]|uniref:Single-strand binding protein, putative n=1 Tax=Babesia bigemina TaxID=5866 RepID=A0A061D5E4_BABBI|nr:single-strand binding protein, putative [Babesia bigemina]CDR94189.1 single-strand binding protein, putative [Babesia bigemina]|eukprot:XP_012766375.1 single-strand binding protein, putative [Babesia bigemina]
MGMFELWKRKGRVLPLFCMVALLAHGNCLRLSNSSVCTAFLASSMPIRGSVQCMKSQEDELGGMSPADDEYYKHDAGGYFMDDAPRAPEGMSPTLNTVTLCGRIGFIDQPVSLGNGNKALRLSIATNDVGLSVWFNSLKRGRMGAVRTSWHKVVIYGQGNVDYIQSRARVGERALVVGALSYYTPQTPDGMPYRAKIAEVAVRQRWSGHTFILMPRTSQLGDDYANHPVDGVSDSYSNP